MDVWSDWTAIAKTIAALSWWWVAIVGAVVVTGAIGVWSWLTERVPRRQARSDKPAEDALPREEPHDATRSAA